MNQSINSQDEPWSYIFRCCIKRIITYLWQKSDKKVLIKFRLLHFEILNLKNDKQKSDLGGGRNFQPRNTNLQAQRVAFLHSFDAFWSEHIMR